MPRPEPEDIAFFLCFAVIFMVAQSAHAWDDDWNPDCTGQGSSGCGGEEDPWNSQTWAPLTTRGWTGLIVGISLLGWLVGYGKWGRSSAYLLIPLLLYLVWVWIAKISVARGDGTLGGKPQCNALLPQSKIFTDGAHMTYKIFIYLIMIYLLIQFWQNPDRRLFLTLLLAFPAIILFNEAVAWIIGLNIDEEGASAKSIDIVELYKNYILGPGKDGTYGDSPEDDRGMWWIAEGPKLLLRLALVGALIYGAKKLTSPWSAYPWMALVFVFIITAGFPLILRFMISDNCLFSRVADEEKTRMNKLTTAKWWECTLDKYGGIQAWFIFVVLAYIISVNKS